MPESLLQQSSPFQRQTTVGAEGCCVNGHGSIVQLWLTHCRVRRDSHSLDRLRVIAIEPLKGALKTPRRRMAASWPLVQIQGSADSHAEVILTLPDHI